MLNSKLDLFQQDWIDTIFEGRNKAYGAYDLRKREASLTVKALVIGAVVFSLLISAPLIMNKINLSGGGTGAIDTRVTVIELPPPPPPTDEVLPPPPPKNELQSIKEVKKFTPPVVGDADQVTEEIVQQKDLRTALAGSQNIDASEDGSVVITETASTRTTERQITEDRTVHSVSAVQVMPEYPGGMKAFIEYIIMNLHGIQLEDTQELRMQFRFVIEKDGSLTDIRVENDGGQPSVAERAVRVLGKSQKWSPGIINGRPVRVAYTVPIVVKAQ